MRPPATERLRRCLERGNKTAPAARGKWAPAPAIVIDAPADIAAELRRRASEGQTASDALHAIGINAGPNATWEQAILRRPTIATPARQVARPGEQSLPLPSAACGAMTTHGPAPICGAGTEGSALSIAARNRGHTKSGSLPRCRCCAAGARSAACEEARW